MVGERVNPRVSRLIERLNLDHNEIQYIRTAFGTDYISINTFDYNEQNILRLANEYNEQNVLDHIRLNCVCEPVSACF